MKQHFLLAGFLFLAPGYGLAQVTVNPAALQQLAGIEPPPPPPPPPMAEVTPVMAPVHHWIRPKRRVAAVKPVAPAVQQAPPQQANPQQATMRVVPPLPKPAPLKPAAPMPAKPPAAVALVFAPGSADLPGNAKAVLKPFCAAPGHVAISARAAADPSDPSAAMRLSLARAMAVQQALASCGVPGINIVPRALGTVPGRNEDETVVGSGAQQ